MDINAIHTVQSSLEPSLATILKNRFDFFCQSLEKNSLQIALDKKLSSDFAKVLLYSEFAASTLAKNPQILKDLFESKDLCKTYSDQTHAVKIEQKITPGMDVAQVKSALQAFRLQEIIRIAWRDLTGRVLLDETLTDLSNLADAVTNTALKTLYDDLVLRYGIPVDAEGNFQQLIVLGMGKLGAKELNFSSDIDLIFVYPETGYTNGEPMISNDEFFTKLCRNFLKFFSAASGEPHFYRVDTRLRPYGDGGPIVMSISAFESYCQAQGREWERYAMIKARPIAGDVQAGLRLLNMLNSFVYRRYFDYGSFDSFRDMKHRIALQVKSKKLKYNIKLGAGGIREIEFFGQLFQLIRAGVEPELKERKILKVLELLVVHHCIERSVCDDLTQAYVFLRMVENRLQAYADRQTHDIPENPVQRMILGRSMGYEQWQAFENDLNGHMGKVHGHFNQLLIARDEQATDAQTRNLTALWVNINDPQFVAQANTIEGFESPDRVLSILKSLEEHPNTRRLSSNGRNKLARLVPLMVKRAGLQENSEAVLLKLIDLIIAIERRTCYLSLLIENSSALENLINLACKSPWIITFLSKHPVLLDELMHPDSLYFPPGEKALEEQVKIRMAAIPGDDLEMLLEQLCVFRQISMLRVAAADISGNFPLMKVSDHLTYIAQTVLVQVLKICWDLLARKYGMPEGISSEDLERCGFAIIAYGKVGGLEMGYKSDIDIVFLHNADPGMTRGSDKSIENVLFYSNLGQRIINALSMHTPAGVLYGVDMRLRPQGNAGTIVSHIDAYEQYLSDQAWTWEYQALIRARCVAGDKELCRRFSRTRESILTRNRDAAALKQDVRDMRERMRQDRLTISENCFDLKQSKGGLVDIEFLVQYLILKAAHACPDIVCWTDIMRLVESLDAEGIISGCESQRLQEAYIALRKSIHRRNLNEMPLQICDDQFARKQGHIIEIYEKYLAD